MKPSKNREHLTDEDAFKSDKYEWSQPGFVALKLSDPMARDLLWQYAERRAPLDPEFAQDLKYALIEVCR